jgi:hypothetical protein
VFGQTAQSIRWLQARSLAGQFVKTVGKGTVNNGDGPVNFVV